MPFELTTPRLTLRELRPDDLDFVAAMLGHPEVMRYYPKVLSLDESLAWLERQRQRYEHDGHGLWLVQLRESATPVGQAGLLRQEVLGTWHPEIAYLVHHPYWRLGYATEAARAVQEYAWRVRGCRHVISMIRPENEPSQRVAERLGMAPRERVFWRGYTHDMWRWEVPV